MSSSMIFRHLISLPLNIIFLRMFTFIMNFTTTNGSCSSLRRPTLIRGRTRTRSHGTLILSNTLRFIRFTTIRRRLTITTQHIIITNTPHMLNSVSTTSPGLTTIRVTRQVNRQDPTHASQLSLNTSRCSTHGMLFRGLVIRHHTLITSVCVFLFARVLKGNAVVTRLFTKIKVNRNGWFFCL